MVLILACSYSQLLIWYIFCIVVWLLLWFRSINYNKRLIFSMIINEAISLPTLLAYVSYFDLKIEMLWGQLRGLLELISNLDNRHAPFRYIISRQSQLIPINKITKTILLFCETECNGLRCWELLKQGTLPPNTYLRYPHGFEGTAYRII